MIFIIDGPNGSGKSTVLERLQGLNTALPSSTYWVSFPHRHYTDPTYFSLATEERSMEVFTALYRKNEYYVFDRLWPVTSVVYSRIRGQAVPEWLSNPPWMDDVRVIALFDEPAVLLARLQARPCCKRLYGLGQINRTIHEYRLRMHELNPEHILITRSNQDRDAEIVDFVNRHCS